MKAAVELSEPGGTGSMEGTEKVSILQVGVTEVELALQQLVRCFEPTV